MDRLAAGLAPFGLECPAAINTFAAGRCLEIHNPVLVSKWLSPMSGCQSLREPPGHRFSHLSSVRWLVSDQKGDSVALLSSGGRA